MRRRVDVDARIDHPVERVFAYLADPTTWHTFAPAVAARRQIGEGPGGVGTRWTAIDRIGPFKVHFTDKLVDLEPGRRVVWESSAPWNARTRYLCEPDGTGTRVRARYEGDIGGWLRLFAWVPTPLIARVLAQDFKRLGARLAADAHAQASSTEPKTRAALRPPKPNDVESTRP